MSHKTNDIVNENLKEICEDLKEQDLKLDNMPSVEEMEDFDEGLCQRCGDVLNNADGEICQKCHIIETTNNNERHIDTLIEEKYEQR